MTWGVRGMSLRFPSFPHVLRTARSGCVIHPHRLIDNLPEMRYSKKECVLSMEVGDMDRRKGSQDQVDTETDQRSVAFLGQWLRENESRVVPLWIAQLRTKGGLLRAGTQELGQPLLLEFYDRLAQVVVTRKSGSLEQMLRRLISDHAHQNYDIRQILQFPTQLKSILWRSIFRLFGLVD